MYPKFTVEDVRTKIQNASDADERQMWTDRLGDQSGSVFLNSEEGEDDASLDIDLFM
jgi:hypothetical protein